MVDSRAQDQFLKDAYHRVFSSPKASADYPDPILNIYHQLIKSPHEKLVIYYEDWMKHFSREPGINAEIINTTRHAFLQLSSDTHRKPIQVPETIKIYVPLKQQNAKREVISLFGEITKEGIKHNSRIMSSVGNDDVGIKVTNLEDLDVIASFVNSNFGGDLLPLNPFVINYDNVGVILDNTFSINKELARLIFVYISKAKEESDVTLVGFNHFIEDAIQQTEDHDRQAFLTMLAMITKPNYRINNFSPVSSVTTLEENNLIRLIKDYYYNFGSNYVKLMLTLYFCGSTIGFSRSKRTFPPYNLSPEMIKEIISQRLSKDPNDVSINDLETYINEIVKVYNQPSYIETLISTRKGTK